MDKNEKIRVINSMLETIGLSTTELNAEQQRNVEYVFRNYLKLNPELRNLDAVKTDRFIQSLFNINYLIERETNVWEFNHFFIEQVYHTLNVKKS